MPDASALGPTRDDYGGGTFRRRILVRARGGAVHADLEDDFHRFGVVVECDGARVGAIRGRAERFPWTTCPAALAALGRLEGAALTRSHRELSRRAEPSGQCTHLLDLAVLAITCAARGDAGVDYRIEVGDREAGRMRARLARDGRDLLDWHVAEVSLVAPTPEPFLGRGLLGFAAWAEGALDPDLAEAAQLLRRAIFIAVGRQFDFDAAESASTFQAASGNCYSFQPERIALALRARGNVRDFTAAPERLLRDLDVA